MFVICTININGLNNRNKQQQVINFMKYHRIDILLIQEHNIRDIDAIGNNLSDFCHISLNLAICHKGGTAILINKSLPFKVLSEEKSADSRIISMKLKIYNQFIHIVNVYAHSGNRTVERDNLFTNELVYYLRNSLQSTFIGGDWNCILSQRDTNSDNIGVSKALLNTVRTLNLKDVWFLKHKHIEYTFVRTNFGSRIDRAYVKDLSKYVSNVKTIHVNFSDHSCLYTEFKLPDIPQKGKYYWKMNVSLLDDIEIKNRFKIEWERLCFDKNRFKNINDWWDLYVKKEIKSFFIIEGKQIMERKYGLIQYLEYCLNKLYNKVNVSGTLQYNDVKMLKDRIEELKNEILEGVKVRSRVKEQEEGEKVSAFLIKQQANVKSKKLITSIKTEANVVENLGPDIILNDKSSITMYIQKYYEKLYKKENVDEENQEWFLQYVNKTLTEQEQGLLEEEVGQNEIYQAVRDMNLNKSPGIDGIPIEFYVKYWNIIKSELTVIIQNIIKGTLLNDNQRKAIITLLPKDGDLTLLKTWRPISLICCDVKIVAKVLARRLKPLMYSLLSENQHCVVGRSIVECNTKIRDIMYYSGKNNITGAIINVDWEKAFDRVNWEFLIKIMKRMRFPNVIINWILTLYTNIQSLCLVNGNFTDTFNIYRGVRQGCPLSMLFFVIFQNPLYVAIENANKIKPIVIPGNNISELGYADDTNLFVCDDNSILEIFKIFNQFEKATNSKINIRKTKIYGYGKWANRRNWPIADLKVEVEYFSTLGIVFSTNYKKALDTMWTGIYNKIKNRIALIKIRHFTLFQKATLINCLIASKLWYASHVYPLPLKYSNMINKVIFPFIWGSNADPIKRVILYNKKSNGGLGLLNIHQKAKSIFVSTMIKSFLLSSEMDLIRYYLSRKIGHIFNITFIPVNTAKTNAPYYEYGIDTINKCTGLAKFPNIKSKDIYEQLVPQYQPEIMAKHAFDWTNVWKNLNFKFLNINDRNIMFKFIYEILPTNKRLAQIRIRDSALCDYCNIEDNNTHRFYLCLKVKDSISFLRKIIFYICGLQVNDMEHLLYLDIPKIDKKNINSLSIIISCYISSVWFNRGNLLYVKNIVKAKILRERRFHMRMLGESIHKFFSENYCKMDVRIVNSF